MYNLTIMIVHLFSTYHIKALHTLRAILIPVSTAAAMKNTNNGNGSFFQ